MDRFQYMATVIIPVFNAEKTLEECLNSIVSQTLDKNKLEVLIVDDHSADRSHIIEKKYVTEYPYIYLIQNEHHGVSSARNTGIQCAKGKYLFYLDSDDKLSKETIENVILFFEENEQNVDLVTYPLDYLMPNGTYNVRHYRYGILKYSGIYDLNLAENRHIAQTTMNICVKNVGARILFNEEMEMYEDQDYNTRILSRKWKIGFCAEAQYIYRYDAKSVSHQKKKAYYTFEMEMKYWERLFDQYNFEVPYYIQGIFLNHLRWKTEKDSLLPYHYEGNRLQDSKERIIKLLNRVTDGVIMTQPGLNQLQKIAFIYQKTNTEIKTKVGDQGIIAILDKEELILAENKISLKVLTFKKRLEDDWIEVRAVIDTGLFAFIEKPDLYIEYYKSKTTLKRVELKLSSFGNVGVITKELPVWGFSTKIQLYDGDRFRFIVKIEGVEFETICKFSDKNQPFSDLLSRHEYCSGGFFYSYHNGYFEVRKLTRKDEKKWQNSRDRIYWDERWTLLTRKLARWSLYLKEQIWLYSDCKDEYTGNGWLQFIHDFEKRDGIYRYYVLNATNYSTIKKQVRSKYIKNIVTFGSHKHKLLFLCSRKILTASSDFHSILPFTEFAYEVYKESGTQPEIIYLQRSILNLHQPMIYSADRIWADKEVISTQFEKDNLIANYGFSEEKLILCGMPSYDIINFWESPKKRILYAPSWRQYLVDHRGEGDFPIDNVFLRSVFFTESEKFLNSETLAELLNEYDYELDFYLHPIFMVYRNYYEVNCPRIHVIEDKRKVTEYDIFITDYSSYEFDFVYLKRAIMYFFPDEELFRAGLNYYRNLDLPREKGFGPITKTADKAIIKLAEILERHGQPEEVYQNRMNGMFFHYDQHNRDRLYESIMKDKNIKTKEQIVTK